MSTSSPSTKVLFDLDALYSVLDARREAEGKSWRTVAGEMGLTPATFTRMARGHRPDIDGLLSMTTWLQMPIEIFARPGGHRATARARRDLMGELVPILRAELPQKDANYVEQILRATLKYIKTAS